MRTRYESGGQSYQIGSNYLTSRAPLWYALPDVVAAKLLCGRAPRSCRPCASVPSGRQAGLRPAKLRGRVRVDPRTSDFFRAVIEERKRSASDGSLSDAERAAPQILPSRRSPMRVATASSPQMNRKELPSGKTRRGRAVGTRPVSRSPTGWPRRKRPGPYCFPPLAALITAGAKLMLALLECVVTSRGGSYVFCDTDSMAIVASEAEQLAALPGRTARHGRWKRRP